MTADEARAQLDAHLKEILAWHFSEDTGCPFWLDWLKASGWDPREEIQSFDDISKFDHFQDEWLRDEKNESSSPGVCADRVPSSSRASGGGRGVCVAAGAGLHATAHQKAVLALVSVSRACSGERREGSEERVLTWLRMMRLIFQ